MRIAIVGYGKMGKEIEKILISRGHNVAVKATKSSPIRAESIKNIDVAIDFSTPQAVVSNIQFLVKHHIPVIVGTTGWGDDLPKIKETVTKENGSLLYASNFSIGVNLFFSLNNYLAKLMQPYTEYHPEMTEIHHTEKLDAPSGTAISLAEDIIKHSPTITDWYCPQRKDNDAPQQGLKIEAIRKPKVKGTHRIDYHSAIDSLSIEHKAYSRTGFALGAVIAAEWIQNKKGIFTMKDVLQLS